MYRVHRFCNAIPRYPLPEYRWQKYRDITLSVTFVRKEFVATKQDGRVDDANIARFLNVALNNGTASWRTDTFLIFCLESARK